MGFLRITQPATRFQSLARRPGGISRERALEGAGRGLVAINESMEAELQRAAKAAQKLLAHGLDTTHVADALDLCDVLHDLGFVAGFGAVTEVAGRLAGTLDGMKRRGEFRPDVLDCFAKSLALAAADQFRNAPAERVSQLMVALDRLVAKSQRQAPIAGDIS